MMVVEHRNGVTNLSKGGIGASDEGPVPFRFAVRCSEILSGLEVLSVCCLNSVWPVFNKPFPGISIDLSS